MLDECMQSGTLVSTVLGTCYSPQVLYEFAFVILGTMVHVTICKVFLTNWRNIVDYVEIQNV